VPDSLLITGCRQLLTLAGPAPRRGRALRELGIIPDGALLVCDGAIRAVGPRRRIERLAEARRAERLDLAGCVVLPGFVDSHTHLVFPAPRLADYELRVLASSGAGRRPAPSGAGLRRAGGILETVRRLRRATEDDLARKARAHLAAFAACGATTVEAKSGYGLDEPNELKILRLHRALAREGPLELVSTFLGAHVLPPEFRRRPDAYVDFLARRLIPRVAREGLAEFCDVYCDRGAFSVPQARRILTAGRACGLEPRLHAEQLARTGGAQLAVELAAASADHLEQITAADVRALAASNVVCTLLPGCNFHLGQGRPAPARALVEAGAIVALATDFNPGTSPTASMPMVLSLAVSMLRLLPAEAVAAATINAAYSLRRHRRIGSLEPGKQADLAVFDVEDYREIPYYFGMNRCWLVMKRGKAIFARRRPG
jgi:imidazolonepropionase